MAQFNDKALTHDGWTVIARSRNLFQWEWENGYHPSTAQSAGVVTMQRRMDGGFELVARLYDSNWRIVENWFKSHPLPRRAGDR